jgi:hypothetical protein
MANGIAYPAELLDNNQDARLVGTLQFTDAANQPVPAVNPIVSGALPTVQFVSATGAQVSTAKSVNTQTPITDDATNNAATLKVELSPDGSTYSTLGTYSWAAGVNTLGAIVWPLSLAVPQGWYVKLTATHCTIGATTYW